MYGRPSQLSRRKFEFRGFNSTERWLTSCAGLFRRLAKDPRNSGFRRPMHNATLPIISKYFKCIEECKVYLLKLKSLSSAPIPCKHAQSALQTHLIPRPGQHFTLSVSTGTMPSCATSLIPNKESRKYILRTRYATWHSNCMYLSRWWLRINSYVYALHAGLWYKFANSVLSNCTIYRLSPQDDGALYVAWQST